MTVSRRVTSALLALVLVCSLLSPTALAAGKSSYNGVSYSTDYTTWKQADPAWGPTALGDVHTMSGSGCLVSAIAILMCYSGAYDPASLNPGVLRDWLDSQGCISHSEDRSKDALLSFGLITQSASPRFYFSNQEFFATSTPLADVVARISELQAAGNYVVARVQYSGHFVPVGPIVGSDARLFDPGVQNKKLLSEYDGTIGGLIWFKANTSGKDTILPSYAPPGPPVITNFNDVHGTGDAIPLTWSGSSLATHYNVYVEQKQGDGSWKANYRYYFYVASGMTMDPLPAGTYRVFVQAANANTQPWTYTNSEYESFTVKQGYLTVRFDANGGLCPIDSVFTQQWAKYQLPTPTRTKGGFLGWYSADGKLVTDASYISSAKGHTLTAKWDTANYGLHETTSYGNQFVDVSKRAWYYDSVAQVYSYGLMNGLDATHFHPTDQITAAQAITLASRTHKLYTAGSGAFSNTDPWTKAYTDYATSKKIISKVPADLTQTLTRQEFAAIIANALPDAALPAVNTVEWGSIPDVYRSDDSIYKLYRAGILGGRDATGLFSPNDPITRAEVATVLVRMADPNSRLLFNLYKR